VCVVPAGGGSLPWKKVVVTYLEQMAAVYSKLCRVEDKSIAQLPF
jgi:hypothetical protein